MSVIAALGANILVAVSKFIGFAVSGSAAMLNESIHSIVDCGNEILLLVGNRQSTAKISDKHPFGQARAKYFYSLVVAMMLFFAGGALGIMEATEKLFIQNIAWRTHGSSLVFWPRTLSRNCQSEGCLQGD